MRVAITGSTGLVGSEVVTALSAAGHEVVRLVRRIPAPGENAVRWDPVKGAIDAAGLEGLDAVIHLAGENVGSGRWTAARKAAIRGSRVNGTRFLCDALAGLARPPKTLVCASAIGYYGDRGEEPLTEESPPGTGFLAEVCREWEAASEAAARKGIRVVTLRIGVVLSSNGGALARMLPLFRAGLGGVIGGGSQYVSWVALDDLPLILLHALQCGDLIGPVNAVAPHPVTNRELTRALGKVLSRPTPLPVPTFALRLAVGREMADALLLASARVFPRRLEEIGYPFRFPELGGALRHLLGKGVEGDIPGSTPGEGKECPPP
ncbi:TIGR01777 family oxidoreductase [Candidatus Deferrimicrobium sp.]|uniref:TIGR01777 family oxidoreductase n=1 Tax=Candidatus Deferrimicrobium sp. TaxID=3060586 RepID=UPI002717687B|nr:TIGR01777 family oxidoreductase [Candidatus Deferrimicrobium sp.]MDO8739185.1 TIGR01777 family oxidoreductase [Candidatus Deferrimicrobium sp.]